MVGPVGILNAALQLYQSMHRHSAMDKIGLAVHNTKFVTNGIVLGLLCLFFFSGEALLGYKRWREHRQTLKAQIKSGDK